MNSAEFAERAEEAAAHVVPMTGEALLVTSAGGVINSALIAMLASADAFATRLIAAAGQSAQLNTLQLRDLAASASMLQAARRTPPPPPAAAPLYQQPTQQLAVS
jgi:hypothetical protein